MRNLSLLVCVMVVIVLGGASRAQAPQQGTELPVKPIPNLGEGAEFTDSRLYAADHTHVLRPGKDNDSE